jgi:hypothetical protein
VRLEYATSLLERNEPASDTQGTEPSVAQRVASFKHFFVASMLHIQLHPGKKAGEIDAVLLKTRSHAPIAKEKVPSVWRPTNRIDEK